jgi:tetratricopeptide (TPR) repeat protein
MQRRAAATNAMKSGRTSFANAGGGVGFDLRKSRSFPVRTQSQFDSDHLAAHLRKIAARPSRPSVGSVAMRNAFCIFFLLLLVLPVTVCRGQNAPAQDPVVQIVRALEARDFSTALTLSQSALRAHPDDYRLWTMHGMAVEGTGNLAAALADYRHALKLAPDYLAALEGAAQADFQMGHDSARIYLMKIIAQRPDDARAQALLGILDYRKQNCAEAVGHFARATAFLSEQPKALTEYGSCLHGMHRDEDALPVFAKAFALEPDNPEARYNLALAQENAGHTDEAMKTLEPLVNATPADAGALVLTAELYESKNDTAEAVKLLREALIVNPKDVDAYMQFASVSFDHASPQVGIDIIDFGLKHLPREPRLYLVRGILLTQLGDFARAADDFDAASRIDPSLQFLDMAEGIVESQQHKRPEALSKFRAAVKAHPNEAYAHYLLAEALQEEGTSDRSPEYQEEIAEAQKAVKLDPGLVAARDLLSSAYYQQGRIDLAIEQSRAALARDPDDKQALYHLVLALRRSGSKGELETLVKRLVTLQAKTKDVQSFQKSYRLYESPEPGSTSAQ